MSMIKTMKQLTVDTQLLDSQIKLVSKLITTVKDENAKEFLNGIWEMLISISESLADNDGIAVITKAEGKDHEHHG